MFQVISILFESLIKIIIELVRLLFTLCSKGSHSLLMRRERPLDAQFAQPSSVMGSKEKGFCMFGNPRARLDVQKSCRNAIIIGGSGSGKSASTIIPSQLLLSETATTITHDPSGEIAQKVSGHLHRLGVEVLIVNFEDYVSSEGYNPLHRITTPSDAAPVAKTLVNAGLGKTVGGDSFWNSSSENLLAVMIQLLLNHEPEYRNLANVARLVNVFSSSPAKVDVLFAKGAPPALFEEYKAIVSLPEKVIGNVCATTKAALQLFAHESIALATSYDSIDFSSLRKKRTAIFIQNSIMSMEYLAPLVTIFFRQLFESLLGPLPGKDDLPVFFLIDEASSFKLDEWPLILSNVRKWNIGILLALQERFQLEHLYGSYGAQTIESNCYTKLYFGNQSLPTARSLSELLGRFEYETEKGTTKVRQLLTPQEIRQLPADTALLLAGNHAPMLVPLHPYYASPLRKLVNLPSPPRASKLPWTTVPLLPL